MKLKEIVTATLLTTTWISSLNAQDNNTQVNNNTIHKKEISTTLSDNEKESYAANSTEKHEAKETLETKHNNDHSKNMLSLRWIVHWGNKNITPVWFNPGVLFGHHFGNHDPIVLWAWVSLRDISIWLGKEFDFQDNNSISVEIELLKEYESMKEKLANGLELYIWPKFNTNKFSWSVMVGSHLDNILHKLEPAIKAEIDFNIPLQNKYKKLK